MRFIDYAVLQTRRRQEERQKKGAQTRKKKDRKVRVSGKCKWIGVQVKEKY